MRQFLFPPSPPPLFPKARMMMSPPFSPPSFPESDTYSSFRPPFFFLGGGLFPIFDMAGFPPSFPLFSFSRTALSFFFLQAAKRPLFCVLYFLRSTPWIFAPVGDRQVLLLFLRSFFSPRGGERRSKKKVTPLIFPREKSLFLSSPSRSNILYPILPSFPLSPFSPRKKGEPPPSSFRKRSARSSFFFYLLRGKGGYPR